MVMRLLLGVSVSDRSSSVSDGSIILQGPHVMNYYTDFEDEGEKWGVVGCLTICPFLVAGQGSVFGFIQDMWKYSLQGEESKWFYTIAFDGRIQTTQKQCIPAVYLFSCDAIFLPHLTKSTWTQVSETCMYVDIDIQYSILYVVLPHLKLRALSID